MIWEPLLWAAGDILDVDIPPCLKGDRLAGTRPFIVLGINLCTCEYVGLACTSRAHRKDADYALPRGITNLPCDCYVSINCVRSLEHTVMRRARPLGHLPGNYLAELRLKARPSLRKLGLAKEGTLSPWSIPYQD